MSRLKKRPLKITAKEHINPRTLEQNMQHFEEQLLTLDNRRLAQQGMVEEGSTDAETIANLRTSLNNLYTLLNASDLTND